MNCIELNFNLKYLKITIIDLSFFFGVQANSSP